MEGLLVSVEAHAAKMSSAPRAGYDAGVDFHIFATGGHRSRFNPRYGHYSNAGRCLGTASAWRMTAPSHREQWLGIWLSAAANSDDPRPQPADAIHGPVPGFRRQKCLASLGGHFRTLRYSPLPVEELGDELGAVDVVICLKLE